MEKGADYEECKEKLVAGESLEHRLAVLRRIWFQAQVIISANTMCSQCGNNALINVAEPSPTSSICALFRKAHQYSVIITSWRYLNVSCIVFVDPGFETSCLSHNRWCLLPVCLHIKARWNTGMFHLIQTFEVSNLKKKKFLNKLLIAKAQKMMSKVEFYFVKKYIKYFVSV